LFSYIDQLFYRLPIGKNSTIQIDAAATDLTDRGFFTFSPFESSANGAISRYGRMSPIYRISNNSLTSGTSILGSAASPGVSFHFNPQGVIGLDLGYFAPAANNPNRGYGIGNGSYSAIGQIDLNVSKFLNVGLTYAHTYENPERRNGIVNILDFTGSQFAGAPFGYVPTSTNNYGLELSFRPNQHLIVFGWGGYTQAIAERSPRFSPVVNGTRLTGGRGSQADIWYYAGGQGISRSGQKRQFAWSSVWSIASSHN